MTVSDNTAIDPANAFVSRFTIEGATTGPLHGTDFVAKDLYDIAGHITGCGNPDWARTHEPADLTAPAVAALLNAGATLIGKTHTDELAYSLMGANAHYGTPLNTAAPARVPGGSSSGSVSAVAANLTEIGLGSDTGGSVRLPASFCGVYGIRTTHGLIDLSDAMPLAPSFDTVGWFTRDAGLFAKVGTAYGIEVTSGGRRPRLMIADDAMALCDPAGVSTFDEALTRLSDAYGPATNVTLCPTSMEDWGDVFRIHQGAEIWQVHRDWITKTQPQFGPGVKERFVMASTITPGMFEQSKIDRAEITNLVTDLLGDDGILIVPTSPDAAPLISDDNETLNIFRTKALQLLCIAGLAKLPQINLPVGSIKGAPLGLSLIGPANSDGWLLSIARDLTGA